MLTAAVKKPAVSGTPVMAAQYWLPPRKVLSLPESPLLLKTCHVFHRHRLPHFPTKNNRSERASRGHRQGAPGISAVFVGKTTQDVFVRHADLAVDERFADEGIGVDGEGGTVEVKVCGTLGRRRLGANQANNAKQEIAKCFMRASCERFGAFPTGRFQRCKQDFVSKPRRRRRAATASPKRSRRCRR